MSEAEASQVFMFDGSDPEMEQAGSEARATFGYFWRELAWERRRIVPALDLACVKAPFATDQRIRQQQRCPNVEHMWVNEIDFDGRDVSGELLNSPNWVTSVKQGDAVRLPLAQISDWMYAMQGQVYGAYTVQVLRARMNPQERAEHDQAWGLEFGDPTNVRIIPEPANLNADHPMSINMGASLKQTIAGDRNFMTSKDERGWTILHHLALAGSSTGVQALLAAGADRNAKTRDGRTAADLAESLGWDEVVRLLRR